MSKPTAIIPRRAPMLELVVKRLNEMLEEHGARTGVLRHISEQTGVAYDSLCKIRSGAVPNPGVKTVQALYDYLFPPLY